MKTSKDKGAYAPFIMWKSVKKWQKMTKKT